MREITLKLSDAQVFELVRRGYLFEMDQADDGKVAEALDTLAWRPASIIGVTGEFGALYDQLPGPIWSRGSLTHLELSIPTAVINVLVEAGFLRPADRSDKRQVANGIRCVIDNALRKWLVREMESEDRAAQLAANSWGMGPRR